MPLTFLAAAAALVAGAPPGAGSLPDLDLTSLVWRAEAVVRVEDLLPGGVEGECVATVAEAFAGPLAEGESVTIYAAGYPIWGEERLGPSRQGGPKAAGAGGRAGQGAAEGKARPEGPEGETRPGAAGGAAKAPEPKPERRPRAAYLFLRRESSEPSSLTAIRRTERWVPVPGGIRILEEGRVLVFLRKGRALRLEPIGAPRDVAPAYGPDDIERDLRVAVDRAATFRALLAGPVTPERVPPLARFLMEEIPVALVPPAGGLRSPVIAAGLKALEGAAPARILADLYAALERETPHRGTGWVDWSIWRGRRGLGFLISRIGTDLPPDDVGDALRILRGLLRNATAGEQMPPEEAVSRAVRVAATGPEPVRVVAAAFLLQCARHLRARGWGRPLAPHLERLYAGEPASAARFALAVALYLTGGPEAYRAATEDPLALPCGPVPEEQRASDGAFFRARFRAWRLSRDRPAPRDLALVLERVEPEEVEPETRRWSWAELPFAPSVPPEDRRPRWKGATWFGGRIELEDPLPPGTWVLRLTGEAEIAGRKVPWASYPGLLRVGPAPAPGESTPEGGVRSPVP